MRGSLRVIGGHLKGRRLDTPTWAGLRPTADRLRETLFNVLSPHLEGARWVDACAGTGAVGIEAISRGAAHVCFIEADSRAVALIARNLQRCGVEPAGYTMCRRAVETAGAVLPPGSADIVFLDPPYAGVELDPLVDVLAEALGPGGLLVIEHARRRPAAERYRRLERRRVLPSGDSALSFYARVDDESP